MNREAIMTALFALVSASSAYVTKSRRLKLWTELGTGDKPAIFMAERGDTYTRESEAVPEVVTIDVQLFIYTDAGKDQSIVPASVLNPLIDAVDAALAPSALTGLQTLGGLVSHCWIEGKIMKDPGDLDGDGVAVIPIKILLPKG
jgi:hypothetical protein